ncbi:MAG: polysaccharide deacetylase family protein, partial [Anaerolineales bacterium]|nr:polysaccharide deacetylase family protein [Anaerolineales bacterium]
MTTQAPRCTVLLTFDFDAESSKMAKGLTTPTPMSQGTYGARVGLPRILNLLAKYELPATFFVPGIVAEMHPEKVQGIKA